MLDPFVRMPRLTQLLVILVACMGGCREYGPPSAPTSLMEISETPTTWPTLDEELGSLAAQIPGFAGLYVDSGNAVILLVDPDRQRVRAAEVLQEFLPRATTEIRSAGGGQPFIFRRARYLFGDLHAWRTAFDAQSPLGTVFTDTDERRNAIVVGVATDEASRRTIEILEQIGVPDSARFVVGASNPKPALDSLIGVVRPTTAGVLVVNCFGGNCHNCSLGANVLKGATRAFVTNSHCSKTFLGSDPPTSLWYQQVYAPSIASGEMLDPAPFSGGACAPGLICRYSDATLVRYLDPQIWEGAHIAQPLFNSPPAQEFTHRMLIKQNQSGYSNVVFKVGHATGMTYGNQGNTCLTFDPDSATWAANGVIVAENFRFLCQNRALNIDANSGDSGGPLFSPPPGFCGIMCEPVYLRGLVFAFSAVDHTIWYSPVSGINSDLGGLKWDIW